MKSWRVRIPTIGGLCNVRDLSANVAPNEAIEIVELLDLISNHKIMQENLNARCENY
jgi:hypothetical protein